MYRNGLPAKGSSDADSPATSGHEYTISGVKVHFPCKAYPSQLAMMNQIIRALQRGQNALLESPTGSGKSLALLCAAIAWQRHEQEKANQYNRAVEQGLIEPEYVTVDEGGEEVEGEAEDNADVAARATNGFVQDNHDQDQFYDDDLDDFQGFSPPSKKMRGEKPPADVPSSEPSRQPPGLPKRVKKKTVPKIYFGTRTHKQIAQIIRELNKTTYNSVRLSILGSRDHACVHPVVSKMKNRNEGCKELTDRKKGQGCSYMSNVKQKLSTHAAVNAYRSEKTAWDLEELVRVGKKVRACPYYASRELMVKSQVVFCPYNYLVEPLIRKSLDIHLKGQIVILDEAHNIEDSARSAASWQITQEEVREAMQDLEKLSQYGVDADAYTQLADVCSKLSMWIDQSSGNLDEYSDFGSSSKVWTGTEILGTFQAFGIDIKRYGDLEQVLERVVADWRTTAEDDFDKSAEAPSLHANTISTLEGFFMVLNYLFLKDMRHKDDYRVCITRTQVRTKPNANAQSAGGSKNSSLGTWISKATATPLQEVATHKFTFTVNFWCLNPAVTFEELKETVHSVVLTSGTLSPMASFSSELDVKFPLQLEANHVIDRRQVWISTLSHGPTGHNLNASYRSVASFSFQDEIGLLVQRVCHTVPHGVLLFVPSYAMLSKLTERWRITGAWERICEKKAVICEPKFSDEFEASMRHFSETIEETNEAPNEYGIDGALFIAVCRGKVSEGLDFSDNNARTVICVGIPFPNVKDVQVDLKKKYNDLRRTSDQTILSGNDWYEIQAFRALNQALGRCIRHRNDWGAILMVDDRYQKVQRYINGLSKWVRSGVVHHTRFDNMIGSLQQFTKAMNAFDEQRQAEAGKSTMATSK